jgi:hypothetical protein
MLVEVVAAPEAVGLAAACDAEMLAVAATEWDAEMLVDDVTALEAEGDACS